ncbi:hypothetical protein HBI17_118360 [Parastagonospora nodorum]|nr:hypothetical protein HBI17_118360 [Parastagonospora nodorum]
MTFGPPSSLGSYEDRFSSGLSYDALQHYYSDSEADPYVRRRTGLFKPVSAATSRLQDPHLKCDRNLGWNIDWAVAFIVDHLDKKTDAAESLRSIRIKAAQLERDGLSTDTPYRIFNKLDEALFASHLKNAVYLESDNLGCDVSGATYTQSWGPVTEVKRMSIILNQDVLDFATARDIVAILIHHMIHAYFPKKEDELDYGRLAHCFHFGKIMTAIKELSATHGKELVPLDFGHDIGEYPYFSDGYYRPRRRNPDEQEDRDKWYCTHCYSNVPPIPRSDIDKYYDKYIAPMLAQTTKSIRLATVYIYNDRRHEIDSKPHAHLPPANKTVELIFKDKSYLVETKHLDNLLSIQRAFLVTSSHFLKLDAKDLSESTFHRFLEFIHTGCYRPELPYSLSSTRTSAPIIKPSTCAASPVLADIALINFASTLDFDEVASYAMKRLHSYPEMTEDPLAVLREIYTNGEPPKKLKDWVRAFLLAAPENAPAQCDLVKLESEMWPWRRGFLNLLEGCGGLENEVRKILEEGRGGAGVWVGKGVRRWDMDVARCFRLGGGGFPFQQQHQQQQLLLGGMNTPSLPSLSPSLGSSLNTPKPCQPPQHH